MAALEKLRAKTAGVLSNAAGRSASRLRAEIAQIQAKDTATSQRRTECYPYNALRAIESAVDSLVLSRAARTVAPREMRRTLPKVSVFGKVH